MGATKDEFLKCFRPHCEKTVYRGSVADSRHSDNSCPMIKSTDDSEFTGKIKRDDDFVHGENEKFCPMV